ncbi:hypothetical protein FQN54_002103 [Arachnomyces sp. PD_36]|nr:hypothetical protein FQN54_002103 [Arachnomyces sp. PD_36]
MIISAFLSAVALCCTHASAQYYPPKPEGLTVLESKLRPGVTISYKQTYICETTPGVNSYSGYIHLPKEIIQEEYSLNAFFWYFESRNDSRNSPLSIYLGGGPGQTSLYGATLESGPCIANPDGNSTTLNPWSFNNHVNMLYIDQPNLSGYTYDVLANGTLDLITGTIDQTNFSVGTAHPNSTTLLGTFPVQDPQSTANTTTNSARDLWYFLQTWLVEFPEYETSDDRLSLWGNSYGGFYGESYFTYFEEQNDAIVDGTLNGCPAVRLNLDTLGITNGCLDIKSEAPMYLQLANNNTYGIKTIPDEVFQEASNNLTKPGGCNDLLDACREAQALGDPGNLGINSTVNELCAGATEYCWTYVQGAYVEYSGRNPFDISQTKTQRLPPSYSTSFLNQGWVQSALGVPVNLTTSSNLVVANFFSVTGDPARTTKKKLETLLDKGIKIAFVYGDLDYRCNWMGAESVSMGLDYKEAEKFRESGYQEISTNEDYVGGLARQYGGFSFSRVFHAGHSVASYQPETVYQIFMRAMFNKDVPTGKLSTDRYGPPYQSITTPDSDVPHNFPPEVPMECSIWNVAVTCTPNQIQALQDGSAVVEFDVVVSPEPEVE